MGPLSVCNPFFSQLLIETLSLMEHVHCLPFVFVFSASQMKENILSKLCSAWLCLYTVLLTNIWSLFCPVRYWMCALSALNHWTALFGCKWDIWYKILVVFLFSMRVAIDRNLLTYMFSDECFGVYGKVFQKAFENHLVMQYCHVMYWTLIGYHLKEKWP